MTHFNPTMENDTMESVAMENVNMESVTMEKDVVPQYCLSKRRCVRAFKEHLRQIGSSGQGLHGSL